MEDLCENALIFSDDDDDDADDIEVIVRVRKAYKVRARPDLFNNYDDEEFLRKFRFRKRTFHTILGMIEERIRNRTEKNHSVPPNLQLLLTLRYYATGTFQAVIGDLGGIRKSTTCRIIKKVTEVIASWLPVYVNLPRTANRKKRLQVDFYRIAQFPRVIGAIDCTHVRLKSPGGQYAEVFRNRKGVFSLNVQAICDSSMKFMDIVARWPGSSHDSTIFNASRVRARFLDGRMGLGLLLGDNGYACSNIILTPLLQTNTRAQELYNESHIRTRNVVERAFGVWKRRLPVLAFGLRMRPESAQAVIVATAVLHNIARTAAEPEPPIDIAIVNALEALEVHRENVRNAAENGNVRASLIETHFSR